MWWWLPRLRLRFEVEAVRVRFCLGGRLGVRLGLGVCPSQTERSTPALPCEPVSGAVVKELIRRQ